MLSIDPSTVANLLSGLVGAVIGSMISIAYTSYLSYSADKRKRRAMATGMMNEVSTARDVIWRSHDHLKLPTLNIGAERVSLVWTSRFVEFAELFNRDTVGLVHDFTAHMELFNELADAMRAVTSMDEARMIRAQQAAVIDLLLPISIQLRDELARLSKYTPVGQRILVDPKARTIIPDGTGRVDPADL